MLFLHLFQTIPDFYQPLFDKLPVTLLEYFPFVVNENEIYFSSNRQGGLGKLDLYKYTNDGASGLIQNAGAPMNSEYDDFAIYIDSLQEKGYFSTNREDNQDDI